MFVFEELKDAFGQAVRGRVALEDPIAITHQPELVQDPQDSGAVLDQPQTAIVDHAWTVSLVEDDEPRPVVTHQPIGGSNPQVSIARLENGAARILRQAVIGRPQIEIVFADVLLGMGNW